MGLHLTLIASLNVASSYSLIEREASADEFGKDTVPKLWWEMVTWDELEKIQYFRVIEQITLEKEMANHSSILAWRIP